MQCLIVLSSCCEVLDRGCTLLLAAAAAAAVAPPKSSCCCVLKTAPNPATDTHRRPPSLVSIFPLIPPAPGLCLPAIHPDQRRRCAIYTYSLRRFAVPTSAVGTARTTRKTSSSPRVPPRWPSRFGTTSVSSAQHVHCVAGTGAREGFEVHMLPPAPLRWVTQFFDFVQRGRWRRAGPLT